MYNKLALPESHTQAYSTRTGYLVEGFFYIIDHLPSLPPPYQLWACDRHVNGSSFVFFDVSFLRLVQAGRDMRYHSPS